jgi:hypothetical protein
MPVDEIADPQCLPFDEAALAANKPFQPGGHSLICAAHEYARSSPRIF